MTDHVLIAGATGLVGYAAMKHFAAKQGCRVTAISRRRPAETFGADFHSLDLMDPAACRLLARQLTGVTHVVYASLFEKPGLYAGWFEADQIETNRVMLENLSEPLFEHAKGLRHLTLLQGTKAYGAHARPLTIPAREGRDEARDIANFYWEQEDYVRKKQLGQEWRFSILRPQVIFGMSIGGAMNLIPALGVYAALLKDRGEPLHYPGGDGPVVEAVDADLLARVIDWAGRSEAAGNEVFNVTNGDVFGWKNVWPAIADALGMEVGEDAPERLGESMPPRASHWDSLRKQHSLLSPDLGSFVGESFHYADFVLAHGATGQLPPALVSTIKLRQAGFHEVIDTEAMFREWFKRFQEARLLPPR